MSKVSSWDGNYDPYDNHSDIRQELQDSGYSPYIPNQTVTVVKMTDQEADDSLDEFFEEEDEASQEHKIQHEALKRIEQAKLYEILLNHQLFAQGSARAEILDLVTKEIRSFVLERLELLVGLKTTKKAEAPEQKIFSAEEIQALKILSQRILQKTQITSSEPRVNTVMPTEPKINPVMPTEPRINTVQPKTRPRKPQQSQQQQPPALNEPKPEKKQKTQESQPQQTPEEEMSRGRRGKAVNPNAAKMPSQQQVDLMNLQQVQTQMSKSDIVNQATKASLK